MNCMIRELPEWANCFLQVVVAPFAALALVAWFARVAIRHRYVMILAGLFLLMAGCAIYSEKGSLLAPVCNALSTFFPSRGDFGPLSPSGGVGGSSQLYYAFHFAAMIYVLSVLLAFFGISLVNRLFVACRVLFRRPVSVFWDCPGEARRLAGSVPSDERGGVVFALQEKWKPWMRMQDDGAVHVLSGIGWKWVYDDPGQCRMLLRAERHFFLNPNGHDNVACAESLVKRIQGNARKCTLYVRVDATADDDVVYKWADRWNRDETRNVEIVVVRENALVSRRFLARHPMLQCPRIGIDTRNATVSGDFKVLVLGFGSQGRTLLNDMVCDAQYLSSDGSRVPFTAHVFDHDPASYGTYEVACREAVSRYHIKFESVEIGSSEFWRRFQAEISPASYNRIVVCLRDDRENISIASDIARIYKEMRIPSNGVVFARVRNSLISAGVDSAFGHDESMQAFTPFGSMDGTYSFDNIVTRKWEKGAVWLNGDYNKKPDEPHDASLDAILWKETSSFNKESSRASFFHQRNLLRLIGYRVDETGDSNDCFKDDDPKNHLEILAEDEHMRWMAFHFVRGVKVWSPSEREIEERIVATGKAARHNAITEINAHADLVDYPELPAVDGRFDPVNARHGYFSTKDTQEKDKGFVRSEAMRQSGLGIKKV